MDQTKLGLIEGILGHTFTDRSWVIEAFQAAGSSVLRAGNRYIVQGNKGLAGIGDRIATLIVTEACYDEKKSIGATNSAISRQLSNERMAFLCDDLGLTVYINAHVGHCGQLGEKTKAATVEAVIGAAYKEGGIDLAKQIMANIGIFDAEPDF